MGLILASKSKSRENMLRAANIKINAVGSGVDEAAIKSGISATGADYTKVAERLALEKALAVSKKYPGDLVIGADQVLVCENKAFDKAQSLAEAEEHLKFFRGKTHVLVTSLALVENGNRIWCYTEKPELTMTNFSDRFLKNYIKTAGDALLHSVGAYFLEEKGITLFSKIEGDYHAILGLPLLPLLQKLRELKKIDG